MPCSLRHEQALRDAARVARATGAVGGAHNIGELFHFAADGNDPRSANDADKTAGELAGEPAKPYLIAGIDEAGRGPLAGPVVAAAVILPETFRHDKLTDSKQLTASVREEIYEELTGVKLADVAAFIAAPPAQNAPLIEPRTGLPLASPLPSPGGDSPKIDPAAPQIHWAVAVVESDEIDRLNILRATHHAMRLALGRLPVRPHHALIDGRPVRPFPVAATALVKGDAQSLSIAAASVLAKVTRDQIMLALDRLHPEYLFAQHKGYDTPEHHARLQLHGPAPVHRRSFRPVREAQQQQDGIAPATESQLGLL